MFIAELSKWANDIQEQDRARQVLSEVREELSRLASELPLGRRDKEAMLRATIDLDDCEHRLNTHKKTLHSAKELAEEVAATKKLLKECKTLVQDALTTSKQAQERLERDVVRVVQAEFKSAKAGERVVTETAPEGLLTALERCGIHMQKDAARALSLFEKEFLLVHLDEERYRALLVQFVDALEEEL